MMSRDLKNGLIVEGILLLSKLCLLNLIKL